jgi:murein DD-endopeptidase MepM/ murein hydrolase activator NlpD
MAKFFKKSLNKSRKKKNDIEAVDENSLEAQYYAAVQKSQEIHEKQGLIADLETLGRETQNDFLRAFPKTPAEIAEEEAIAAREEARLEELATKVMLEEAKALEVQQQVIGVEVKHRDSKPNKKVKKPITSLSTNDIKSVQLNKVEEFIAEFTRSFGNMAGILGGGILCEFAHMGASTTKGLNYIRSHIFEKVENYYSKNPDKRWERHQKNRKLMRKIILTKNSLIAKEKAAASKMVRFINHVDKKNEEFADKTTEIVSESNKKFNLAREWAEINKAKLLAQFGVILAIAICIAALFNYATAYEYAYNGRTLGMVEEQEDVLKIVDIVSSQLSKEHSVEIYIDRNRDITFERVFSINKDIDDTEDVLNKLTYMKNMSAKACGIYVNDIRVAILDSKDTAKTILDSVKSTYLASTGNVEYERVNFKENVELKQIDTKLGRIQNPEIALQKIMTGAVSQQIHVVESGDTLSGIAKDYAMTISDLKEANPTLNPEKLSIGQEIVLTKPAPLVTIQTVEVLTYAEAIPFETENQDSSSLYKGETKTKVKGVNGEQEVTARITRENGIQVNAVILETQMISQPTTQVVITGTKELPPLQGTGSLRYPVSGARLSSPFGTRWGRMHSGIDLACATGTRIGAADGGTVTFSGYSGSYGYVVKINHGGGVVTVYAHCSKLLVSKGDKVYQGQHIANVGSTGRSTGPHCHFEVQINGVAKNPLNYL